MDNKKHDELMNAQGYDLCPSEYRTMNVENIQYNPNIDLDDESAKTYLLNHPRELEIVSINQLMQYEHTNAFDYREAHGTPSLLEHRIPKQYLEKFLDPPNILSEFDARCALYKNDN